jgi:aryl-alcohol dehydrogenase-like predicted oxidoreductase
MEWLRPFGYTGLKVTALGLGGGQIGNDQIDETTAEQFLNAVLDAGVTLIDTARGYNTSEERIGKYISHRRSEYVLSTKVGYGVDGYENWTPAIIAAGIDRALKLLKTDIIDICHLHSCPVDVLKSSGVVEALNKEKEKGKIKVAAYSGENDDLSWAAQSGAFGSLQTSINVTDQLSLNKYVPEAVEKGMGVIAKRPMANAPWRFTERPVGDYSEQYWGRWKQMGINPGGLEWQEVFLRFAAYAPGVNSAIAGTANKEHFLRNIEIVKQGPLPAELNDFIRQAYVQHGESWTGQT